MEGLGSVLEQPGCEAVMTAAVNVLAASGVVGGFSLQAAMAGGVFRTSTRPTLNLLLLFRASG